MRQMLLRVDATQGAAAQEVPQMQVRQVERVPSPRSLQEVRTCLELPRRKSHEMPQLRLVQMERTPEHVHLQEMRERVDRQGREGAEEMPRMLLPLMEQVARTGTRQEDRARGGDRNQDPGGVPRRQGMRRHRDIDGDTLRSREGRRPRTDRCDTEGVII